MGEEMGLGVTLRRVIGAASVLAAATALAASLASGASPAVASHGALLHLVKPGLGVNANKSSNWFGYNQGSQEQGGTKFHSIAGDWTVPTARQHTRGGRGSSPTGIGIGGGGVAAKAKMGDRSRIQRG